MKKGFTLIELLVVIAIIGILAGIVLVSVGTARNKAKDVSIQSNLANMRAAGEMYADANSPNGYAGFCTNTGTYGGQRMITAANDQSGLTRCGNASGGWAACARMVQNTSNAWCVDSDGSSRGITNAVCANLANTAVSCP